MSVVIPCRDHGRFVGSAIESVLTQTHRELEVIVVDDGSTDDTPVVVARYPVRAIRQEHAGVCVSMNRGITASRGELVMSLGADDLLAPTYVEETVRALAAHPEAAFAYTEISYIGARSGALPVRDFDVEALAERNYVHGGALVRRSSFDRAGGYSADLTDLRCEDWDLWLSFAELGLRGVLVRKPLVFYRKHADGGRNAAGLWPRELRRELKLIARLQDHHPAIFAPRRLLGRLARLPRRLATREVSLRHAALVTGFYAVMLARVATRARPPVSEVG